MHQVLLRVLPRRAAWDYVVGTRRVDLWDPNSTGYHGSNAPRYEVLDWLKPYLTRGMTVYGEHVGYFNGSPIMPEHNLSKLKDKAVSRYFKGNDRMVYDYGAVPGEHRFIVYRITEGGREWSPGEIEDWVGELEDPRVAYPYSFFEGSYAGLEEICKLDQTVKYPEELIKSWAGVLGTEGHPEVLNEGVVVRLDFPDRPTLWLKEKNFFFKVLEEIVQETEGDPEDEQGVAGEGTGEVPTE